MQKPWVQSLGQEDLLEEGMTTNPVFLPGESHGQRNLVGYGPWGHKELETTEQLSMYWIWISNLYFKINMSKTKPFFWSVVDLQYCISFRYSAMWFSFIYIYIYTCSDMIGPRDYHTESYISIHIYNHALQMYAYICIHICVYQIIFHYSLL